MSHLFHMNQHRRFRLLFIVMILAVFSFAAFGSVPSPTKAAAGYLHTNGRYIVNAAGNIVHFSGINWYGFEDGAHAPHGIHLRNYKDMLDQIKSLGFNIIRMPYSDALWPTASPSVNLQANPDLAGLDSFGVMDKIINYGGSIGLKFILDRHRPDASSQSELPVTSGCPETTCWIQHLKDLALRYNGNTAVVAFDLHNEPHGVACWGCATSANDWRAYATRAGNAVLSVNPDLLIIVEGIEKAADGETTWWGGNLKDYGANPLSLSVANRVVYSPHDYPFSIWTSPGQKWFIDPPNGTWVSDGSNLPAVWDRMWGYLVKTNVAPVMIGEFGTKLIDPKDPIWLTQLTNYIKTNAIDWTFWDLNPDSGDTGGILNDDWTTVNTTKLSYLTPVMYPMLDSGTGSTPVPTATTGGPTNTPVPPTKTNTPGVPTNTPVPPTSGPAGLSVQIKNAGNDNNQVTTFNYVVKNTGSSAVSNVSVRIYYTADGSNAGTGYAIEKYYDQSTVATISAPTLASGSTYYFTVSYGTASLGAGAQWELQTALHLSNYGTTFDGSNDWYHTGYAAGALPAAYTNTNYIPAYTSGTLVWGQVPGGAPVPTNTPGSVPTNTPVPPTATKTNTPSVPTNTAVGPTATKTNTPVPPSATPITPSATPGGSGTCSPVAATITAPFTFDGGGTICWKSNNLGSYINSWNLTSLTVNGVDFTNKYSTISGLPPKASDGYWYISLNASASWGHFEAK